MITISDLRQRQALPLRAKVLMTQSRIREWYNHYDGDVYVSFSGGKDSTVLAHLVHDIYPDVPLIFSNTGLEYPEIQSFARKMGAEFVRPKMMFSEVVSKYGYPVISKEVSETIWYARKIHGTEGKWLRLLGKCFKEEPEEEKGQNIRREMLQGTFETKKRKQQGAQTRSMFNKEKWLPLCNGRPYGASLRRRLCSSYHRDRIFLAALRRHPSFEHSVSRCGRCVFPLYAHSRKALV